MTNGKFNWSINGSGSGSFHFLGGDIMARHVTASVTINGVDDETFGSNEFGHAEFTREMILANAQPQNVTRMLCRWGGECRVELDLTGQMLDKGDVRISGVALLYEGTGEDTNDRDGSTEFTFLVPKGTTVSNQQQVKNTDEAGDFATIDMSVSNVLVETGSQALTAAQGVIYAIADNGDLLWFRHEGWDDGSFKWTNNKARKVGTGWGNVKHVFSGGNGIIYAVTESGDLSWFRHNGREDGSFRWEGPKKVGIGWGNVKHVFSGSNGIIYAVTESGDLRWFRHNGREDGSLRWEGPKKVGIGWGDVKHAFSGGNGIIYVVDPVTEGGVIATGGTFPASGGDLRWFRHNGREDGSFRWEGPRKVGTGWNLKHVFSG
jgi:hypothetical protein